MRQEALQTFWDRWRNEYLKNLPPCVPKFREGVCVDIGSIVLIQEDHVPRLQWDMGIIVEVFPGKDGRVRTVKVKTSKGTYVRSIQRLHKLEMLSVVPQTVQTVPDLVDETDQHLAPTPTTTPLPNGDVTAPVKTRSGRIVRPVNRLQLLALIEEP
jgi:hypothetical protein